jgi:hypothetical protein
VLPLGTSIPDFVLDLVNVSFEEDPGLLKVLPRLLASLLAWHANTHFVFVLLVLYVYVCVCVHQWFFVRRSA